MKHPFEEALERAFQTTFIGALARMEEAFPECVDSPKWPVMREEILTLGNTQMRNILRLMGPHLPPLVSFETVREMKFRPKN